MILYHHFDLGWRAHSCLLTLLIMTIVSAVYHKADVLQKPFSFQYIIVAAAVFYVSVLFKCATVTAFKL